MALTIFEKKKKKKKKKKRKGMAKKFVFFCKMLWEKNPNELFGQPNNFKS